MRKLLPGIAAAWLGALAAIAAAQTVPPSLQPFEREMRGWVARFGVARASLAVMHNDRLVMVSGYGGREGNERVDVWSLSKAITGACIATLVRERKLGLNDLLGSVLAPLYSRYGGFADGRMERISVAELLTHRAGISRVTDNDFAPGVAALLRKIPPRAVTPEMLMPEIFRLQLARDPGAQYEYSNIGYLLLGQVIEVRTGQGYAEACGRRVLAPAGIRDARLDSTWGGLLQAAGGWSLSAPEYLAFLRLLRAPADRPAILKAVLPGKPDFLTPEMRSWLTDGNGKWIERGRLAYTLGVLVRFPDMNLFHGGGWIWRQPDAAGGPIAVKAGTWAVLTRDGTAWVATFDTVNESENPDAIRELDQALWHARRAVASWPDGDLFASLGIGPVTGR